MERRLTAILSADVVGYSRLMEVDEAGTLAVLKEHRKELIHPAIDEHHGRIVKLMGDGTLVEFASVVDAVTCAVAIQTGMAERNDGVPADNRIEFRIGVHLGDIIVEDDDIYGDGVNVAARLEGLAEPGGICLSQQAYDQVETKLDLQIEDLGEQQVKNIARPV
ncbi:MAG: adenylate/guanylate cyclase domain-containing protein, partial [Alphaproteobacteria bacterium]